MAVTGIRKTSSYTLHALVAISIVVFLLFFFGGSTTDAKGNVDYNYTDALLYWTYFLSGITILATLFFAGSKAIAGGGSKKDSIAKVSSPIALGSLVVALVLSYILGSGEKLGGMNVDAQQFNTEGWLKLTDMWLFSTYILFGLTVLAAAWGAISKSLLKK